MKRSELDRSIRKKAESPDLTQLYASKVVHEEKAEGIPLMTRENPITRAGLRAVVIEIIIYLDGRRQREVCAPDGRDNGCC